MSVMNRNGAWTVIHRVDGKQRWKSFGCGIGAEKNAREYDASLKSSGKIRSYNRVKRSFGPTLIELVDEYLKVKAATLPAVSIKNTTHKFTSIILPQIGLYKAMRLTNKILNDYVTARSKEVKLTTIHRELSDIQAVLNWSVKNDLISQNPVAGFEKPPRDDEVIRPPTPSEVNAILDHAPEHLHRALTISYYTGLRPGNAELFRLHWSDVDLIEGFIHVVSARKGGIKERSIPLHPTFKKALERWCRSDGGTGPLVRYHGKPIKSIKTAWRTTKIRAGITRRLRPYDFRHAFATLILNAGGDLKSTSELLGHSRTDTTTRIYQHTNEAMHRKNINRLPVIHANKKDAC